jgi:hypothetical protein
LVGEVSNHRRDLGYEKEERKELCAEAIIVVYLHP